MEKALAGDAWLAGPDYSLADINLMPYVARLEYLGLLDLWTSERPRVMEWWARARARPAFRQAIDEPLTAGEKQMMAESGARIRTRVGELRAGYLAGL
jgi:glutathione S-transferase